MFSYEQQNRVDGQKGLRDDQPAVGAVVERSFQPLGGGGGGGAGLQAEDKAGQSANPLGAHRIAFVGHGRRADLLGLERFFELLAALQQPQIGGGFRRALGHARQGVEHLGVDFAGIGLAGDGIDFGKAESWRRRGVRARAPWRGRRRTAPKSWPGCRSFL